MEYKTMFAISVTIFLITCLIILLCLNPKIYFQSSEKNSSRNENEFCLTEGCKEIIYLFLNNMNTSADPCDDFYEFTCGKFEAEFEIPEDESETSVMKSLNNKVQIQLKNILDAPIQSQEIQPFVLVKNLYSSCMNELELEAESTKLVKNILKKVGGWPVVEGDNWNENQLNWINISIVLMKFGFSDNSLLDIKVNIVQDDNTRQILSIDEPKLGLYREFFMGGLNNEIIQAYFIYMNNVAVYFGANEKKALEELTDVLEFEINLANIMLSLEDQNNITNLNNQINITDLQSSYPFVPWLYLINTQLPPDLQINATEMILIAAPNYLKNLEILLSKTPNRTICNYMLWRIISEIIPYLSKDLQMMQHNFGSTINGQIIQSPRWKDCTSLVASYFSIAVGALYIRKHFYNPDAKKQMEELVGYMKNEFIVILKNTEWMDEKTKGKALEKIDAMMSFIAYPDELFVDENLIKFYENLTINKNRFLESILNIKKFFKNRSFRGLRETLNKTSWAMHSNTAIINAFYSPSENSIDLPAGILHGLFFSRDRPKYLNYGGIGFVIGHEMIHGFDDVGRQFDKNGNVVNWWKKSTSDAFVKKSQCFVEQYGNYSYGNLTLNGKKTLSENIADNGGIRLAYLAYKRWLHSNPIKEKILHINFTTNQLFWINAASAWCSKIRPEYLKASLTFDAHSSGRFRVNGFISNQEEFAKDFSCPIGTNMHRKNKCKIW